MKKRILSFLLAFVMLVGMLPVSVSAAATDLPVSGGTIDITDTAVGSYTVQKLEVYLQTSYEAVSIVSATQDGTTINVVLSADTDPSAAIQAGFSGSGSGMLQHSGNKCTLSNGTGSMTCALATRLGPQLTGSATFTINFSMPMGESCTVTPPTGEGFTFTGNTTAYEDSEYSFQITVDEAYDGSNMVVKVNGETVTGTNGTYTVESVSGDLTITVEGLTKKKVCNVTLPTGEGYTVTGEATVYKGNTYTFTVAVAAGYDGTAMVVKANDVVLTGVNGSYTVAAVNEDITITVEGIVPKEVCAVTLTPGEGYTLSGQTTVYRGESYSFTVTVRPGYSGENMVVKANDAELTGSNGGYTVENVTENLTITVAGVESTGVVPTAILTGGRKPHKSWGYVDTITIDQVQVEEYIWVGDDAYILLSDTTADDASALVTFKTGGSRMSSMADTTVALTDGVAEQSFTAKTTVFNYSWAFTLHFSNKGFAPTLASGVNATAEASIYTGDTYTLDLEPLFSDIFGKTLTYYVQVGDGAYAPITGSTYSITPDAEGTVTLTFKANNGKLDSQDTYTLTLTVQDLTYKALTVKVPESIVPKFYTTASFDANGMDVPGTELAAVKGETADGLTAYTIQVDALAETVSVRAEGFGGMAVSAEDGAVIAMRSVQTSLADLNETPLPGSVTVAYGDHKAVAGENGYYLLAVGTSYSFTSVPEDTAYQTITETKELEAGVDTLPVVLKLGLNNAITITATTGAKVQLYDIDTSKYYVATEFEAKIVQDNGDGTTTHYFSSSGSNLVYRVSLEGKITKMGYFGWNQKSINMVYGEDDKADTYRLNDYSGTGYDNSGITEDSVLLNINGQNNLSMSVGQAKILKAYRAWEIIKISYQNYILTPDFTYTVLSGSDVVSLTEKDSPSTADGDWMTLTALKKGVAVIEVTYDAVEVAGSSYDGIYGASDPARTGLVVVQVGGHDSSVDFGIDCYTSAGIAGSKNITYNSNAKRTWDAEFDTLYFTGNSGELSLTPTAGSTIAEVAVSNNKGASWTVLTGNEGTYTAKIVSGNNIIRVTTASGTAYQVVRGDQISVNITEVADQSDGDGIVEAGETVRVTLVGLHMPIPKMAGNYNPGFLGNTAGYSGVHLNYTMGDETVYSTGAQYNFITTANSLEITMPEDGSSVTLSDGYIGVGVIGLTTFTTGGDSHRNIPDSGCGTRASQTTYHTRSILPAITISVTASCSHAETATAYAPVEGTGTHTVTVTCNACSEQVGEVTTTDCTDEDADGKCDLCEGSVEKADAYPVTITAPIGSVISVGTMHNYFVYEFAEAIAFAENVDAGTVTYGFPVPTTGGNAFVRVQNPDNPKAVTYWNYTGLSDGTVITITEDDLFINDDKHDADTIIHDLSEYEMDVADVYINANAQGYLPMNTGETFEFNVFRDWHAVEGISNAKTALPDVSYRVIDVDGSPSNVVSIVPDANNSSVATMTANKAGTAIVLVTYDAMYSTAALHGSIGTEASTPEFFSAIWPENTGVLVVTVGADGSAIETNMTLNGHALDAEHDVLYYIGNEGAVYTFAPGDCKVSVARATLTADSLTYSGFEPVEPNNDGSFTVSGLTAGSHIIKVEKDGVATYQVICAKQTTVTITDADGNLINEENPADPGETVIVQLGDIYNPVNKLSGVYNSNCAITYVGENGITVSGGRGSSYGYYLFASDPAVHRVSVTLPEVWAKETYTLNGGYFAIGGNGSGAGAHRDVRYAVGKAVNNNAAATSGLLGRLPEIVIPVNASERIPATSVSLNKSELTLSTGGSELLTATVLPENSTDTVVWSSSDQTVATVDKDGLVTGVAAGEAVITATVGDISATCTVTVSSDEAVDLVLTTVDAYYNEVYAVTMLFSEIVISGVEPTGTMTGVEVMDGQNVITDENKTCTVYLEAGNYESVIVSLKPLLGGSTAGALGKLTYSVNGTTSNTLNTYTDYIYTTSVTPEWNEGQAVLEVALILNGKTVRDSYTINLVMEESGYPDPATYIVTLPTGIGYTVTAAEDSTSPVTEGGSYSFTVAIADGYEAGEDFAVKVNGSVLTADEGVYTIENITADQTVTVEGVVCAHKETTTTYTPVESAQTHTVTVTCNACGEQVGEVTTADCTDEDADGKCDHCEGAVEQEQPVDETATVYFSVSHDAEFIKTDSGTVAALQELDVPYFDLSLYGLDEYKLAETDEGYGKPTMLHLYIYATEIFQCGVKAEDAGQGYLYNNNLIGTDLFAVSGSAGSIFMEKFWNMSMNLNYYHNYSYPADADGWGITADRVVLSDGDIVTIGHFTSWGFYGDSSSVFNYLVIGEDTVVTSALETGEITLNVYRAGADMGNGGTNTPVEAVRDIYYVKADALTSGNVTSWTKLGTTDATGQLTVKLSELTADQYILALAGQKGVENPKDIVSTPGGIILNVLADEAGKQVQNVINLIDAIGEVTLDSESAITSARNAYDALIEEQQAAVTNYTKLTDAEAKLAQLKQEKADQDAADAVTAKINAIGTVTLDSKTAIEEAREAFDALTDAQKALISEETLKKLTDAEAAYAKLIADEADKAAAKAVEEKITAIGTVTLDSEQKITAARQAYDALTDTQKQLVGNYESLTAAEKKLAELKDEAAADAVEAKIAAIGTVTLDSEDTIKAARAAYDALTDTQKALVENLSVLEAAEETLELLKLAGTDITDIYKATGDYLAGLSAPGVGSTNGEWRVIGLVRAGREVPDSFYEAAVKYVQDNIDENGRLHAAKSTDNSRLIIALTAIGKDVTDVGGYDLLSGLNDMAYIGNQGINGTIWALLAFDTHDYEIPAGDVTREKLVQAILDAQLPGGGWALAGTVGDPDMTGMALQALAPYYGSNAAVTTAVDKALIWLSGIQAKDGTFTCSEGVTSESLSQVITALTALGINPETDSRFIKNGVSAVDALSKFYVDGGGFKHSLTGERNMMATEQGYYALVSYYRLLQGKTSLYDMSDVTIQTAAKDQEAADAVEALIDAIGTVTKDSGDKIKAARDAYDALTDAQKKLVENYKTLTDAEAAYAELVKTAADEAAAKAVEDKINAIGTVTLNSENKIKEARAAYDKLTAVQKALVGNYDKLTAAEQKLIELKDEAAANEVEKLIDAIGTVTLDSEEKISAARNAYDALTENQKKLVENYKTLTDAESKLNELKSTVSVTFTLLGCSKHGSDKVHTLAGGNLSTWIAKKTYMVVPGATVKDVLEMALKEAGMSCSNPTGNYVESVGGIGEFTNGSNSGWMYTLNGTHPNLGVAEQTVKNGDVIVFHYTDDYTKEESSQGFGDRDEEAAEKVEKLIDAIGTVTLNSKSKIDAARKAYDALSYTQKQLVDNYKKLTDAEAKYAQLKAADDEKKAEAVEDLIDAIMPGSTTFEEDVKAAQKAYNNLTADQKKLVDNYYKLLNYQKELADEEDKEAAKAVEDLIDAIGTVTKDSEDEIKAARDAYQKLTDEQKELVGNLAVLEAAEERLAELKALAGVEDIYKTTGDYLEDLGAPSVGSVGGEWMVIGLIRSGREIEDVDAWYDLAVKYVQENIDENERLHQAKSTENARLILALTAIGKDVSNVGGHDLLKGLNSMEYIQKQGINGPIWALLAFNSGNYPVPEGDVSRAALIQVILDAQLADGGWALTGATSDPDITGMALQALAPYYQTDAKVKEAIDDAIVTLSEMQAADGSYASIDGTSSESISQVIVALAALGIDADKDARFIKNGTSALDALCAFYVQGGGFKHIPTGKLDGMATEQAYYALAAYFRMLDGKTALYNMTDVIDLGGDPAEEEPTETLPAETESVPTEPGPTDEGKGGFPWWLVIVIVVLAGSIVVLVIVSKPKKHKYVR